MNNLKTVVLMVTLTLMLVFIGAILGGKSGMTIALVIAFGHELLRLLVQRQDRAEAVWRQGG